MAFSKGERLAHVLHEEGITQQSVLSQISSLPRQQFLPDALAHKAFENTALPIGQGQTISAPYTVARMTELLLERLPKESKILELGTGSGYQTAILAGIFDSVFSVERIKSLQFQAKRRLNLLDLHNVKMKHGDGWEGWSSKAPFDGIIVTAAASSVPQALIEQLSENGRLVVPIGTDDQKLLCIDKHDGEVEQKVIESVRFVPLVAGAIA